MKLKHAAGTVLVLLVFAGAAVAGDTLSVQLVKATSGRKDSRVDSRLQKVAPALERNLAYTGYSVQAATAMPLPADGKPRALGPYQVRCSGSRAQLTISVEQNSRPILRTRVVLSDRKPLILGGLPSDAGAMMLMFEARQDK